jgi:fumarate reductase subunit D
MRIVFIIVGVVLIVVGVFALLGAVDVLRGGGTTEQIAQSFLVPASLFVVGAFAIWGGWQRRG